MTRLDVLRDANESFGFRADIEELPAEIDCPVHEIPMILRRLQTVGGWQQITVCPAFDGSCRYDPNGHPMQIEDPAPATGTASGPAGMPGGF